MPIKEKDFISFISVKQNLDKQSIRHCAIRISVINRWFAEKELELTKLNVERFFYELKVEKGRKNNTLNTYRFVFRHLVAYCKDRGLPSDFFDGFKSYKKGKSDIVIFTLEEIERIINTELTYGKFRGMNCQFLDFRYRTLTMFLAYTGCRFGEAADLKVQKLDLSAGTARFVDTKNDESRTVYFIDPLKSNLRALVEGLKPEDCVFRNAMGKRVHEQDYSEDLKKRARQAGVTKRTFPHNFRHSYITHLIEEGLQAEVIAKLTGHKDIQVIYETYMHLADRTLQRAAMRHPLVRRNVDPHEIMQTIKDTLANFHFENDKRFDYKISEDNNRFTFELIART